MLVLAKERDEPAAERRQVGGRGRAPLDEGARAGVRADAAGQHELVDIVADQLPQVGELGIVEEARRDLEHALHVGLAGTGTDDPRTRLSAQQQVERVGEHGLAGAGLAGDGGEPRPGAQLGALDQEQVLDAQLEKHHAGVPVRPDGGASLVTL